MIGDRWSLLIMRDMMVRGFSSFKQFQGAGEGIATNVLADRLTKLRRMGVIAIERDECDKRTVRYRLTKKGIALAPVLLEVLIWGARNESPVLPDRVIRYMQQKREEFLAEVTRRWRERDPRPFQVDGRWMLDVAKVKR